MDSNPTFNRPLPPKGVGQAPPMLAESMDRLTDDEYEAAKTLYEYLKGDDDALMATVCELVALRVKTAKKSR